MVKKIIISVVIIIVLLFVLCLPISQGKYDDGGTSEYTTLAFKIVKWNKIGGAFDEDSGVTCSGTYKATSIYWFPDNFKSIDELWKKEAFDPTELLRFIEQVEKAADH